MARRNQVPAYRLHKHSGQAVVTLNDSATGARKDRLLGPYETAASRAEYGRVIAEWEARGRRIDDAGPAELTIAELLVRFLRHAETYYGVGSKEYDHFEKTTVPLTDTFPHKMAKEFGPAELKVVRQRMIDHHDWSRKVVNRRVNRVPAPRDGPRCGAGTRVRGAATDRSRHGLNSHQIDTPIMVPSLAADSCGTTQRPWDAGQVWSRDSHSSFVQTEELVTRPRRAPALCRAGVRGRGSG